MKSQFNGQVGHTYSGRDPSVSAAPIGALILPSAPRPSRSVPRATAEDIAAAWSSGMGMSDMAARFHMMPTILKEVAEALGAKRPRQEKLLKQKLRRKHQAGQRIAGTGEFTAAIHSLSGNIDRLNRLLAKG